MYFALINLLIFIL